MEDIKLLEKALFRYTMIAPLLDPTAGEQEKKAWRHHVTHKLHALPNGKQVRVAERTLREWAQHYREKGFQGLIAKGRRDRGAPRKLPEEVLKKAIELKEQEPRRSIPQLIQLLELLGIIEKGAVKRSTLARHLALRGKSSRSPGERSYQRYQMSERNKQWQSDVLYGPYLDDPDHPGRKRRTYLIAFLDDYSRLICHAQFYWDEDLVALLDCFKRALLKRGIPRRVYVDNGLIYQSNMFHMICAELGIRHISSTRYAPEGKGKIERFFRTLEDSFLLEARHESISTLPELNECLWAWLETWYHTRIHSETGQTPLERFLQGPGEIRRADPVRISQVFLWRETRRVDKTACFSFNGRVFEVDPALARKRVEIHYDPQCWPPIQVWYQGKRYTDARPLELEKKPAPAKLPEPSSPGPSYLKLLKEEYEELIRARAERIAFRNLNKGGV